MSNNLYEISTELARINDELFEAGGELTDELEKRLDGSTLDFKAKVENIGKWVLNLSSREEALDKELTRLTARKRAIENLQKRLKEYVKTCMEMTGTNKLEYTAMTIAIQKNPAAVEIQDEKSIPAKFLTIIPEQKVVDKKAVLAALKAGESVSGAVLADNKTHLRIR